jgi:DNA polymerase-3 subunit delta'
LPTIRSRTQPVKILGIADNELKDAIIRQYSISDQMASDIVNISNGSLFEARKQIITNDETEYNFAKFTELMRVCYGYKIPDAINLCEELAKNSREKQKNFIYYSLVLLRENFAYNSKLKQVIYMTKTEIEFSNKFARFVNQSNINELMQIFEEAYYHIERNVNAKLVFTDSAFKIMKVIRKN